MAEESNQDKKAVCTFVQSVPWHQTELIIRNLATFLGPTDLCSFGLVCKKWKEESSSIWKYHRTRHILRRYSDLGLESSKALQDYLSSNMDPNPLTVFSEHRPPKMECKFDSVWAEELRDFFSRAKEDDAQLKDTSFLVIKLKQWNRFGNFNSGEQEGAKSFLNEVADKVVHLTLDTCNLSISQNEFFPTLCQMTQLKELTIRGTYFQLRKSVPDESTLAEITPLPKLKVVVMNYENCTVKRMPNYNFSWQIFLGAIPELKVLVFSFSNWSSLNFAIQQFSKMITIQNSVIMIIFRNLVEPNQEPVIPITKVMMMVKESMKKLNIQCSSSVYQNLPRFLSPLLKLKFDMFYARVQNRLIAIKFQDHENVPTGTDPRFPYLLLQILEKIQNEN